MIDGKQLLEKGAFVCTYEQLRKSLQRRRQSLGIGQKELDDLTGLPDGYVAKLECGTKSLARSLDWVLEALGLVIIVAPKDCLQSAGPLASFDLKYQGVTAGLADDRLKKMASRGGNAWKRGLTANQRRARIVKMVAAQKKIPAKVRRARAAKAAAARWEAARAVSAPVGPTERGEP